MTQNNKQREGRKSHLERIYYGYCPPIMSRINRMPRTFVRDMFELIYHLVANPIYNLFQRAKEDELVRKGKKLGIDYILTIPTFEVWE